MRRLQETNSLGKRNGIVMSVQMAMVKTRHILGHPSRWELPVSSSPGNVTQGNQVERMSAGPSFYLCHVRGRCGSRSVEIVTAYAGCRSKLASTGFPAHCRRSSRNRPRAPWSVAPSRWSALCGISTHSGPTIAAIQTVPHDCLLQ